MFPRLEELDLTNTNQADGLPVSLGALTNLRTLRVAATAIRDLPDAGPATSHGASVGCGRG